VSDTVSQALHRVLVRIISAFGTLVVLPFAFAGRRTHR
jgi:hypothetical protein